MRKICSAIVAGLIAFAPFSAVNAMPRDEISQIQVKKAKDFKFWNKNSIAKQKLVEYVADITDKKSKNFIPVEDRIAVFDVDLSSDELLRAAWEKSGVTVRFKGKMVQVHKHLSARKNIPHYFVGGREVSRRDAIRQALSTRGWNQVAIDCFEFEDYE